MEEIIELCKKKHPNFGSLEENHEDDIFFILDNDDFIIESFESLKDLRNHLNE